MFPEPLRRSRRTPIARMASPRVRSLTNAPPAHMLRGGSSADSHGDNGTAPGHTRDLHESAAAPLLSKPYVGVEPSDSTLLCYDCHLRSVYATGESYGTGESGFLAVADSGTKKLHSLHVAAPADGGHGISCSACHVSHGSVTQPHLLRSDIGFISTGSDAGTCTNACHTAVNGGARSWSVP